VLATVSYRLLPRSWSCFVSTSARIAPKHWLFMGQDGNRSLNSRTARRIVSKAGRVVLGKHIGPHTLRHSCATHMLETGVNIRVVQGFLGHRRLSPTDRYSHVSREQITATKSPLDLIANAR